MFQSRDDFDPLSIECVRVGHDLVESAQALLDVIDVDAKVVAESSRALVDRNSGLFDPADFLVTACWIFLSASRLASIIPTFSLFAVAALRNVSSMSLETSGTKMDISWMRPWIRASSTWSLAYVFLFVATWSASPHERA